MAWVLGPLTVVGVVLYVSVGGLVGGLLHIGCVLGWLVVGASVLLYASAIDPAGDAAGRLLMPTGSSTPSAKGLSHIEAMVARGDLAKAAEAYKTEIATDPADITSCERLGTLAQRQLRDLGKTVVELRRLVQTYPDAPRLDSLRAEIDELKESLFDEPGT